MKFTDVVNLTQTAVAQTLGATYMEKDGKIASIESFKLVDVGKDVLDSGSVDSYVKSLLTQIGKMIIDAKRYTADIPSIFVDSFDWGGYVERVYFAPQDLIQDEMYNLVNGATYEDHKFYKPNVSAKIFEEAKTIMCPISIARDQMEMAFTGWEQMNSFISGIYTNVSNTIELALEAYAHMLISCGIAVSCSATSTAIHLLTEAKAAGIVEAATTAKEALTNEKFLVFACNRIATIRKYMKRYSTAFNNGSIPTFTNDSDNKAAFLTDFANACKFNVRANTFNEKLLGFGDYDEVAAWQAFKDASTANFDFATNSTIKIAADTNNKLGIGTSAFTKSNVIGVVYDKRAMGLCPYKVKTTSNYTAIADFWNHYYHQLTNYILDSNFPIVAFILD